MTTINLYGIIFGVKYETLMNTDRIYSYSDFPEIFNIEVISVEDLGVDPINFLEENIEEWNQETIGIFEYWDTYNEEEKKAIVLSTIQEQLGRFENKISEQIGEKV